MATKAQIKSFIESIVPFVEKTCLSKARKILPSVCIAQACYESSYGTTSTSKEFNALFSIKVGFSSAKYGSAWKGKSFSVDDEEYRSYKSIEDSITDYYDIIGGCSRYANAINNSDLENVVATISKNSSAENAAKYAEDILKIIKTNKLTKYDEEFETTDKTSNLPAPAISKTEHTAGEKIVVSSYYNSDVAPITEAIIDVKSGTILSISKDAPNPYCFGKKATENSDAKIYGWCNDGDIRTGAGCASGATIRSIYHTVKPKDTLSSIAKKYNTTAMAIVSMNKSVYPNIKSNFIRVGWKLLVQK